jgi:hypothetical protein
MKVKGKGKVRPRTGHEGPKEEWRYSCTLSLTSALDGGGWLTPCPPGTLPQGKIPGANFIGGWVGCRTCIDGCRKTLAWNGIRNPDYPALSDLLYRYAKETLNISRHLCLCVNEFKNKCVCVCVRALVCKLILKGQVSVRQTQRIFAVKNVSTATCFGLWLSHYRAVQNYTRSRNVQQCK